MVTLLRETTVHGKAELPRAKSVLTVRKVEYKAMAKVIHAHEGFVQKTARILTTIIVVPLLAFLILRRAFFRIWEEIDSIRAYDAAKRRQAEGEKAIPIEEAFPSEEPFTELEHIHA